MIVLIGWPTGASWRISKGSYAQALANTETVGRFIGNITEEIKSRYTAIEVYGIGHSLGSHIMGWAGRSSGMFDRITGWSLSLSPGCNITLTDYQGLLTIW